MKNLFAVGVISIMGLHGAWALDETELKAAQVYEIKITVKTTAAKKAKLSPKNNPFVDGDLDSIIYRAQASQKWNGVVWGCDCESVFGRWDVIDMAAQSVSGCIIWNAKSPYTILFADDIQWRLLNAIDKKGNKCEGAWTIGDSSDESNAFLAFSGFGTIDVKAERIDGELENIGCNGYVKSISGNVAGWMPAPSHTTVGRPADCTFCGITDPGEDDAVDMSEAWIFCECGDIESVGFTAVSGTWSLKYSSSLSKKLSDDTSILNVYKKFPSTVKSALAVKIQQTLGND
jgi:hypothetical protein